MTPITFRCLRSGNTVSFIHDHDIEQLRKHEGYVEVKDESAVPPVEQPLSEPIKPRGRPRKGN
jgi:hypothetical protein